MATAFSWHRQPWRVYDVPLLLNDLQLLSQARELLVRSRYGSLAREQVFALDFKLAPPPVQTPPGDAQIILHLAGDSARNLTHANDLQFECTTVSATFFSNVSSDPSGRDYNLAPSPFFRG